MDHMETGAREVSLTLKDGVSVADIPHMMDIYGSQCLYWSLADHLFVCVATGLGTYGGSVVPHGAPSVVGMATPQKGVS